MTTQLARSDVINPNLSLPLLVWLVPQIAALSLAAGRVPLWARFSQPVELLALQFLVAAQMVVASMCFPFLLRDFRIAACVVATGWPMALIAGGLAAAPLSRICAGELLVSVFLIVMTIWKMILKNSMAQAVAAAIASLWTAGGAMLLYFRADFAPAAPPLNDILAGPLAAAVRAVGNAGFRYDEFLWLFVALSLGGASIFFVVRFLRRRSNRPASP